MTGLWKILAVFMFLSSGAQPDRAQESAVGDATLRIRTRVYNPAKVSIPVLSRALDQASAIYQRVGIQIEWIHCPCYDPLDSSELYLFATLRSPFKGSELGYAASAEEGGLRALVFYDRIEKLTFGADTSFALGCVIAHELGHLLLGTKLTESGPHSTKGIMRGPCGRGSWLDSRHSGKWVAGYEKPGIDERDWRVFFEGNEMTGSIAPNFRSSPKPGFPGLRVSRRSFLGTLAAAAAVKNMPSAQAKSLDAFQIARQHSLLRKGPTPGFFEGMLLGNGDIGVCVTTRPDALGLHLGKEDSWDIRVSEDHYQHVLTFRELLKLWERASAEAKRLGKPDLLFLEREIDFFREYTEKVQSSYRKSWPRPWPCGIVWIHWDPRVVRVAEQRLDLSNGLLTIELEQSHLNQNPSRQLQVKVFVHSEAGHVSVSSDQEAPFLSVAYYPNIEPEAKLPPPELDAASNERGVRFTAYQHFPATPPSHENPNPAASDQDRSFFLCGQLSGQWTVEGLPESQELLKQLASEPPDTYTRYAQRPRVFCLASKPQPFRLDLALATTRDSPDNRKFAVAELQRFAALPVSQIQAESEKSWKAFWAKSAVSLQDQELERFWYRNQYFLACCLKPGKVAPGLFGNWMSGKIGTAWHGDYHMNYNTQQVYWGVFSSNHVEQHLPYVELCENLLGYSEAYAKEKFEMPGAFFPHTAYPVPSQTIPYPVPPWGYEICETPWTVQSLWWHYRYTLDEDLLKRVYPLLRAAALFLAAYVQKGDDGKYHIIPTVSPENWGFTVDHRLNKDCIIDLALTEFLFDAVLEASRVLGQDLSQRARWKEIRDHLAAYPAAKGPQGEVWVDVVDAPPEYVYNVPVTLAPVFPAEQVGIGLQPDLRHIAERTARTVRLEGGNDLVYQPLIRARLGMLDLDWFKREVRYCLLPNGTCGDRVRQIGGRYKDSTSYDFMMHMGIWIENLSLPAVINECLLQSYSGTIRLFPNSQGLGPASFRDLRAAGAFLVTAAYDGSKVIRAEIYSEKGAECRLVPPVGRSQVQVFQMDSGEVVRSRREGDVVIFQTQPGQRYRIGAA